MRTVLFLLLTAFSLPAQQPSYDLLLKGGHVIDPKNNISKIMDVAITDGKIARVAENIPAAQAKTAADVAVLRLDKGIFGLLDSAGARHPGNSLLAAEMTIRKGEVVWDLNGRAAQDWKSFSYRCRSVPQ